MERNNLVCVSECTVDELYGKTIYEITQYENLEVYFYATDGYVYRMYHKEDCCEKVHLEDIIGDLDDLINSQIVMVEETLPSRRGSMFL